MKKRLLGKSGLEASALGLGCMGMSFGYGRDLIGGGKVRNRALVDRLGAIATQKKCIRRAAGST